MPSCLCTMKMLPPNKAPDIMSANGHRSKQYWVITINCVYLIFHHYPLETKKYSQTTTWFDLVSFYPTAPTCKHSQNSLLFTL